MELGAIIKNYRVINQITLGNMAKSIDVSHGYITMLEHGNNPTTNKPIDPTYTKLKLLAKSMSMSILELIAKMEDMDLSKEEIRTTAITDKEPEKINVDPEETIFLASDKMDEKKETTLDDKIKDDVSEKDAVVEFNPVIKQVPHIPVSSQIEAGLTDKELDIVYAYRAASKMDKLMLYRLLANYLDEKNMA